MKLLNTVTVIKSRHAELKSIRSTGAERSFVSDLESNCDEKPDLAFVLDCRALALLVNHTPLTTVLLAFLRSSSLQVLPTPSTR